MDNFDKHMRDIETCLTEKIPTIKPSEALSVMAYIGYKLIVIRNEVNSARDEMWKKSFNRECIPRKTQKEDTNE